MGTAAANHEPLTTDPSPMKMPATPRHDREPESRPDAPAASLRSVGVLLLVAAAVALALDWTARRSEQAVAAQVAERAQPGDIHMLSSVTCPYCIAARAWLQANNVPFDECFIERDSACAEQFRHTGAIGTPTFLVRGQRVVGFDRARLADALR